MGCLVEFFFELFVEGLFELIAYCYVKLMQLIVPEKAVSEKAKRTMKKIAAVMAGILIFAVIIGVCMLTQTDQQIKAIGKYMTYISLAVMAAQLLLGIILKIFRH